MEMKQQSLSTIRNSEFENLPSAVCGQRSAVSGRLFRLSTFDFRLFQLSSVSRRRKAFTLIELLVVLAIIGLLMGMLFPALMGARERAKITRARSEIQTIQQAWLAYWNTYGQTLGWPGAITEMNVAAVRILAGIDTGKNPQKIAFMEFDDRHLSEGFRDPWGKANYKIVLSPPDPPAKTEIDWVFETRVHCINTARYRY
jgi:prepilin-type N-terminal cleavage/methylation domain-containing protein